MYVISALPVMVFDLIDSQAEAFDTDLRVNTNEIPMKGDTYEELWSYPLSSWAYYHLLHQMEWIVQLGFELDIYQLDELAGMYWYIPFYFFTFVPPF